MVYYHKISVLVRTSKLYFETIFQFFLFFPSETWTHLPTSKVNKIIFYNYSYSLSEECILTIVAPLSRLFYPATST